MRDKTQLLVYARHVAPQCCAAMLVSDNGVMHLKVNENDKYAAVQTDARERAHSRHALAHIMSQCRGTLINNEPKRTCREDYGKNPVVTRWLVRPLNTIQYRTVPFTTIEYIKGKFICLSGTLHGKKVNAQYTIARGVTSTQFCYLSKSKSNSSQNY